MSETQTEISYFTLRMQQLGITDVSQHTVHNYVHGHYKLGDEKFSSIDFKIFQEDSDGNIRIFYPTLDGLKAQWHKADTKGSKDYYITRLKVPKGDMKYMIPKGSGTRPFFPPTLIKKVHEKKKIDNLFLTEGAFKAFKGDMHGLDIIGLTSITHAKDRITQGLHEDILTIIKTCHVKRVIWLVDGDCNRLSSKPIEEIEDLYRRPHQFFSSALSIRGYLDDFDNVEKWFVHPLSDDMDELKNPKGLDDLLLACAGNEADVIHDLTTFSKRGSFKYFHKINMTYGASELHRYFKLSSVDDFYHFHLERRPDLRQAKEFTFNGTRYQYNEEKNVCVVTIPGDAKNYFRVGDQYYEKIKIPNKYNELEKTFHRRMKGTIGDDYGREFCKHIAKFKAFCNLPDHINYQEVIHSCYNVYGPFDHEAEPGDCENTLEFLRHIFGVNNIHYKHPMIEGNLINEFELGMDYLQLLYQKPTQTLPILCLVSRENATGKSTFAKWLKMIYQQNAAIVGNAELADNFNASWATRLLVICDEAKIDKQIVVEKVKSMSTADKILMNAKGKDHVEIDFFAKFIFLSNNEDNFIYASDDDVRYWIRKVPRIKTHNVHLLKHLQDEIPAFLDLLNKRKIKTPNVHRAWFDPNIIKTEALAKVIANSRPTIEKEIRTRIREMFLDFGMDEILMTARNVNEEFFRNKYEQNYVIKVLRDEMRLENYKNGAVARYSYPRWEKHNQGSGIQMDMAEVKELGRPFVFPIDRFLTEDEKNSRQFNAGTTRFVPTNQDALSDGSGELPF